MLYCSCQPPFLSTPQDPTGTKKLSEYNPQIFTLMSAIWIAEYATHHGVSWHTLF